MNFLAHAYLSFGDPEILAGNLISDFVKGKKKWEYSPGIQEGMQLHRMIDSFTDSHPANNPAKQFFRKDYRLYAGAFVDIVYDHFLANDHSAFEDPARLYTFAEKTYEQVDPLVPQLPLKFQRMFSYMRTQNWLYHYRTREGIYNSFRGLVSRAAFMDDHRPAMDIFDDHYADLQACYDHFFPEVRALAFEFYHQMRGGSNEKIF